MVLAASHVTGSFQGIMSVSKLSKQSRCSEASNASTSSSHAGALCSSTVNKALVPLLFVFQEGTGGLCEWAGVGTEGGWSSLLRLCLREPPRPGAGDEILCWRRRCSARASERVKDVWHAVIGLKLTSSRKKDKYGCYIPGRGHVNGFSPVWERMWDMSVKRDV